MKRAKIYIAVGQNKKITLKNVWKTKRPTRTVDRFAGKVQVNHTGDRNPRQKYIYFP